MFREYQDVRIKRNLKYVKRLSLVALILCALCTYTYLFWKWYLYEGMISHPQNLSLPYICNFWGGEKFWRDTLDPYKTADLAEEIIWDFIYCLGYFELAIFTYFFSKNFAQKPFVWRRKLQSQARFASNDEMKESYKESSQNNDITRIKLYHCQFYSRCGIRCNDFCMPDRAYGGNVRNDFRRCKIGFLSPRRHASLPSLCYYFKRVSHPKLCSYQAGMENKPAPVFA